MKPHLQDFGPYRGKECGSNELVILNESFYLEDRDEEIDPDTWYAKGVALLNDSVRRRKTLPFSAQGERHE